MIKPPVASRHVRQLVFWLLVVSFFLIISKCMHGLQACCLFLYSAFMLSMVKLLLKREVGVLVLNSHGNYIVEHGKYGKIMELCF